MKFDNALHMIRIVTTANKRIKSIIHSQMSNVVNENVHLYPRYIDVIRLNTNTMLKMPSNMHCLAEKCLLSNTKTIHWLASILLRIRGGRTSIRFLLFDIIDRSSLLRASTSCCCSFSLLRLSLYTLPLANPNKPPRF